MKLFFALTLLLFGSLTSASEGIMISEESAWARATPPGSKTTAIYLTVMNHSGADISLTAATANISERVELHTHINNDGMMKMQQVVSIVVPAGGQAQLKPHGDHIMVFNLQDQLKQGELVSVELTFDNGQTQNLQVPVRKEPPSANNTMDHDGTEHSGMKH